MNNERYNQIIDEVYENYLGGGHIKWLKPREYDTPMGKINVPTLYSKEELVEKCKTDPDFSERWGLKIEERELSESEIWDYIHKNDIKIKHQHAVLYSHEVGSELRSSFVQTLKENYNIPTKLITVTYKDEKIEVYEENI